MSGVMFCFDKVVELFGGGSVINVCLPPLVYSKVHIDG